MARDKARVDAKFCFHRKVFSICLPKLLKLRLPSSYLSLKELRKYT